MNTIFSIIKDNPLFHGIPFSDFKSMFDCLSAKTTAYKKNDILLLTGNTVNFIGLLLSGSVKILKEDMGGNITLLTEIQVPELFGEVFACAGIVHSPVTVQAAKDCSVLYMDYKKIITTCSSACRFHSRLIENMLHLIAEKNLLLNQKIEILSKRTTREKLLSFFDAYKGNSKKFTVPYNREEMAQYLCVDRSAMSNELCKMRDQGLIRFNKNVFELL